MCSAHPMQFDMSMDVFCVQLSTWMGDKLDFETAGSVVWGRENLISLVT